MPEVARGTMGTNQHPNRACIVDWWKDALATKVFCIGGGCGGGGMRGSHGESISLSSMESASILYVGIMLETYRKYIENILEIFEN